MTIKAILHNNCEPAVAGERVLANYLGMRDCDEAPMARCDYEESILLSAPENSFYVGRHPVLDVKHVRLDGETLDPSEYSISSRFGKIHLKGAPRAGRFQVEYCAGFGDAPPAIVEGVKFFTPSVTPPPSKRSRQKGRRNADRAPEAPDKDEERSVMPADLESALSVYQRPNG